MTVDILILGAGWLSTFLIPLCKEKSTTYAATTRSGRNSTIAFNFDPDSNDIEPYKVLPDALTVLITFPIEKAGASTTLIKLYQSSGSNDIRSCARFIQLGTTSIWDGSRKNAAVTIPTLHKWFDRESPFLPNDRANAESEILALSPAIPTTVLNLAGLWGGSRSMRNWVGKVAPSKEVLRNKGSLHMIHGLDVSRAILAVHANFSKASGQRWILTDGRVYDWWDLASAWGSGPSTNSTGGDSAQDLDNQGVNIIDEEGRGPQARWVRELMREQDVQALPRNIEQLGRALDSCDFWFWFGLSPVQARLGG